MVNQDILKDIIAEKLIEKQNKPDVLSLAFPKQREFILDKSKYKTLFCTRRAAKSFTAGLTMFYELINHPGSNAVFFGLSRLSAKAIIWNDVLKVIDRKLNLHCSFNETELTVRLPNGSIIYVTGIDADESEMNKLLGRKYKIACGDEASMYTINTSNLVYGVLDPAVTDPDEEGNSGSICLFGTASNFPRGLFYDITTGKEGGWKVFQWSAHDNPHVAKQWAAKLAQIAAERPAYMETPQYKQWYLNQWVIDEEKLVYRFNPDKNLIKLSDFQRLVPVLSADGWAVTLGVDTGWEDDNAFILNAYHTNDPHLYILRGFSKPKMVFDDIEKRPDYGIVQKIEQFMNAPQWKPHKVIIDGANKQGVESMKQRSNIPFEYADKQDKATFIELCNSDLTQGTIKFLDTDENRATYQEMGALVWVTDGDKIKYPKKEHPNLPNHRCDAFLYSWRGGWHFAGSSAPKKVVQGSREWYMQQADNIWERERERLQEASQGGDWPEMGTLGELG